MSFFFYLNEGVSKNNLNVLFTTKKSVKYGTLEKIKGQEYISNNKKKQQKQKVKGGGLQAVGGFIIFCYINSIK